MSDRTSDNTSDSTRQRSIAIAVWSILTLAFVVAALVVAIESAMHFNGTPIDGPFQLYDALRRIAAGYRPGIDFQFFHGLGVPYLYYGLFRAFGAGLRGSELARNLVSPIAFLLTTLVFFRAFLPSWSKTLAATAMVFALAFTVKIAGAFFAIVFAINGMLGVRASMPVLLPVVLYRASGSARRVIGTSAVLGLSLFYGSEQGMAGCAAFVLVSLIAAVRGPNTRGRMAEMACSLVGGLVCLVLALMTVAGWTGMRGALRYNFSIVPGDQFWYFGAPPNVFVPSWGALIPMMMGAWQIGVAAVLGLSAVVMTLRRLPDRRGRRDPAAERRSFALAVFAMYGVLSLTSLLGVFTPVYSQACWRVIALLSVLALFSHDFSRSRGVDQAAPSWLGVPRLAGIITLVLAFASFILVPLVRTSLTGALAHVIRVHLLSRSRFEATGIWPEILAEGQAIVDTHRGPNGAPPTLWSTYSGWIEARNGIFNPSFDYIIHALGPDNRAAYLAKFKSTRPTLVQTVRPTFTQYEPWLENASWPFYDELLTSYDAIATTPWSIYWERRATPAPAPIAIGAMQVPAGMTVVPLPQIDSTLATGTALLEVEIDYAVSNPWRWLPIVGRSPRYLVGIDGALSHVPVSLDPYVTTTRFPLVLRAGQHPSLYFATRSLLPGVRYTPRALRLSLRPITGRNATWLADLSTRLAK